MVSIATASIVKSKNESVDWKLLDLKWLEDLPVTPAPFFLLLAFLVARFTKTTVHKLLKL